MLRLKVTPVVGLPQFTGWSQVAESTVSVSVRLILVYAISGRHAGNVGRDISEKVSDFYFYDVEQLHDFLNQLVDFAHSNECKIYFSCAVLGRTKSVFATYGGSVFLRRGDRSGKILMSDYEVKVVEGNYVENDIFVLTTLQADQFLNEVQLKFQQGYDTDIIITSVVPGLHAQDDSSLSALVFINKDEEREEEIEKIKEQEKPIFEFDESEDIEVEGDLEEVDLLEEERNKSNVRFEVDAGKIPEYADGYLSKIKPFFSFIKNNLVKFILLLLILIKKLLRNLIHLAKKINLKKVSSVFNSIKEDGPKSIFKRKTEYLLEMKPKKGLWKFIAIATVIFLFLVLIGYFSYQRNKEKDRITLLLNSIQLEVEVAKESVSVDPITTREVVAQAIDKLRNLENENESSSAFSLISEKRVSLEEYLESISGREELQDLDIFYDLRLVKSDFIASGIDFNGEIFSIYDKDMKQVLLLDHDSKKVSVKDFSDKGFLTSVVTENDSVFVLTDGIYKFVIDLENETDLEEVRNQGDSNKNATLMSTYDRFVYVINPEKRNIYRYSEGEDGYSDPIGWIKSATGLNYDELRSIAVDGDVWLTTSDGQLKKFTSGREEGFDIRGLQVPFEEDLYVYTNEDMQNIYVLDASNSRVVSLKKDGNFIKEYKSVSLGAASNITVSESLNKIFVVSGSIIYQIDI